MLTGGKSKQGIVQKEVDGSYQLSNVVTRPLCCVHHRGNNDDNNNNNNILSKVVETVSAIYSPNKEDKSRFPA